jgi:hypothetical protein
VYEGSFLSASSTTFGGGVLDRSHSNKSEVDLNVVLICISFMPLLPFGYSSPFCKLRAYVECNHHNTPDKDGRKKKKQKAFLN